MEHQERMYFYMKTLRHHARYLYE